MTMKSGKALVFLFAPLCFVALLPACREQSAQDECRADATRFLLRTICAGNAVQLPSGRANVDLDAVLAVCAASLVADAQCDSKSSGDLADPSGYFE